MKRQKRAFSTEYINRLDSRMVNAFSVMPGNLSLLVKKKNPPARFSTLQKCFPQVSTVNLLPIGPIFPTQTKPDYSPIGTDDISQVHQLVSIPIYGIGGVTLDNLPGLLQKGLRRVVIVSAILLAKDITAYVRAVKHQLIIAEEETR